MIEDMNKTTIHAITKYITSILENQGKRNFSTMTQSLSHDQLTRAMGKDFPIQTLIWRFLQPFLQALGAYFILDDTIVEKPYSRIDYETTPFIRWVFSHKDNKPVKGIQVVCLVLVVGSLRLPIGFRIYDKSQSKIQLALDLFSFARNRMGLKQMVVLFDSWYPAKVLLKRLSDYGWSFVCRIKKNRKVNGVQVKHLFPNPYNSMRGTLQGLEIVLVRNRQHYLVTNRLMMSRKSVIEWYAKRGQVEEVFRALKDSFHLNSCQSRTKVAWKNHLYCCGLVFMFVEFKRVELGMTVYKAKLKFRLREYRRFIDRWKRILELA